mmetsp:Transcript_31139/g.60124  ORF Transcript_31139/g.60124 Transcript_31139/m.60124 type:complete len:326 (+) Transcript_31139:569-1546(+)
MFSEAAVKAVAGRVSKRKAVDDAKNQGSNDASSSSSSFPSSSHTGCMLCSKRFSPADVILLAAAEEPRPVENASNSKPGSFTTPTPGGGVVGKEDEKQLVTAGESQALVVVGIPGTTTGGGGGRDSARALVPQRDRAGALVSRHSSKSLPKPRFQLGDQVLVLGSNGKTWNRATVIALRYRAVRGEVEAKRDNYVYSVEYSNGHISQKPDRSMKRVCYMRCPSKHRLERFLTTAKGFECNVCRRVNLPEGYEMFGCRKCDWDACHSCFKSASSKLQASQVSAVKRGPPEESKASQRKATKKRKKRVMSEKRKLELLKSMGGRWVS